MWVAEHLTQLFIAAGVVGALALWIFASGALPLRDGYYSCTSGNVLLPVGARVQGDRIASAESSEMMNSRDPIVDWTAPHKNGTESFRMTVTQRSGRSTPVSCTWKWES